MRRHRMKRTFFTVLILTAMIYLVLESKNGYQNKNQPILAQSKVSKKNSNHLKQLFEPLKLERFRLTSDGLTGEEMFIWYAFYDTRDPLGPRIRILANVVCKDFKINDIKIIPEDGVTLTLEWAEPLGLLGCEGGEGGHCRLQEMELSSIVYRGNVSEKVVILRKTNQVTVKLHRIPAEYKDALNTCVSNSLFWYNDWPRLFLFLESWRRNKVNKILLHIHSASKEVMQVIDHYVKEGLVEVRPFPLMPNTVLYNPNNHIWYVAQHLVMFFCSVWSDAKYTTMNDVDEIFYVRNRSETLLDVAKRLMDPLKYPDIGGIWLEHHALSFPDGITGQPWDLEKFKKFAFLKLATPYRQSRSGKYIYLTQYAKRPWIHGMREFYDNKWDEQAPNEDVVYLHMRNNYINVPADQRLFPDFEMFDDEALVEMRSILDEIFKGESPPFNTPRTMPLVESCIKSALTEIPGQDCTKPTGTTCYEALKDQDQWLYAVPTEDSHFVPL